MISLEGNAVFKMYIINPKATTKITYQRVNKSTKEIRWSHEKILSVQKMIDIKPARTNNYTECKWLPASLSLLK